MPRFELKNRIKGTLEAGERFWFYSFEHQGWIRLSQHAELLTMAELVPAQAGVSPRRAMKPGRRYIYWPQHVDGLGRIKPLLGKLIDCDERFIVDAEGNLLHKV